METAIGDFIDQCKNRNTNAEPKIVEGISHNSNQCEDKREQMKKKILEMKKYSPTANLFESDEDTCKLCEDLSSCLIQRLLTNAGRKIDNLPDLLPGIYTSATTLVFIKNDVAPKQSMPVLLKYFEVSEFKLWQIVKTIMSDKRNKVIFEYLETISVVIQQTLLWSNESVLWTELPKYDTQIPTYEQLKNVKEHLQRNIEKDALELTKSDITIKTKVDHCCTKKLPSPDMVPSTSVSKTNPKWKSSFLSTLIGTYNYVHLRFEELCEVLCVSTQLQDMWTSFNHALTHHCEKLFCNRHLDQIILCIVYAVRKSRIPVQQLQFKAIFLAYKQLRHSDPAGIQNGEKNAGGLLSYYSKVFLPAMESYLLTNLGQTGDAGFHQHSPLPDAFHSPVRNITKNITISPLRDGLPSLSGSMEYTFSSSPRGQLHNINEMVKVSTVAKRSSPNNSGLKYAKKISFAKDDDSPVKSTSKVALFR